MTTRKPAPKKAPAATKRARGPQRSKPKVDTLRFFLTCFDEAETYKTALFESGYEDRPFRDSNGEEHEGLEPNALDEEYAMGFRDGIAYALTGQETRGLATIWQRVNVTLHHKSAGGAVEFIEPVKAARGWWRRNR